MSRLADVEFASEGGLVFARLTGEIDQSNAATLGEALTEAISNESLALVLDLSRVGYFDSAGIQLIYELRGKLHARGQTLRMVIPSASPSQTALRLAGVTQNIEVFESEADALQAATA